MAEESWISICGKRDAQIEEILEQRVQEHVQKKDYSPDNVSYLAKMNLHLSSSELQVSDEMLEKLRRLCQLWDVSLKPLQITSHRKYIGPLIVFTKKLTFRILQVLLKDFIRQQRSFNAACVDAIANSANQKQKEVKE